MTTPMSEEIIERITIVEPSIEVIEVTDVAMHAFNPVIETYTYTHQGILGRYEGTTRQYVETAMQVLTVRLAVDRAAAGDDIVVDLKVNGVSIFWAGQRPRIFAGQKTVLASPATIRRPVMAAGSYITADLVQEGSVFPGADLTVTVRLQSVPAVVAA